MRLRCGTKSHNFLCGSAFSAGELLTTAIYLNISAPLRLCDKNFCYYHFIKSLCLCVDLRIEFFD